MINNYEKFMDFNINEENFYSSYYTYIKAARNVTLKLNCSTFNLNLEFSHSCINTNHIITKAHISICDNYII